MSTASTAHNWIKRLDGSETPDRSLIGGKAHSIARIIALGLKVPPAIVITTRAHSAYLEHGDFPDGLLDELGEGIAWLEAQTDRRFGMGPSPLLVSVRSGAAISMPGMMDTVLNVGMTEQTELALAAESGSANFAHDTHRRFVQLYSAIVLKQDIGELDGTASSASWRAVVKSAGDGEVPDLPLNQLTGAVRAVFDSWNARRARRYREHQGIAHDLGTAVTIQAMVFGNLDDRSGTGVLFSRNPSTGGAEPFGEYLRRAQGEDVVSGQFTPEPLDAMARTAPAAFELLLDAARTLEREERQVQDIEFTVERETLYFLQARAAKLAPRAAVHSAIAMAREGLIDIPSALARISPDQVRLLMAPLIPETVRQRAVRRAAGEAACPGVGSGIVVADPDEAERRAAAGETVILARPTTSPHDLHGMIAATAVITEEGGATSHAAVVCRALGKPCVVSCGSGTLAALTGETVTVDGQTGDVFAGVLDVVIPDESADADLAQLTQWVEPISPIRVLRPGAGYDAEVIDLSHVEGAEEPENLPRLLAAHTGPRPMGAMGGAVGTDAGVRACIEAGLAFIVAEPVLPPLLAAAQFAFEARRN